VRDPLTQSRCNPQPWQGELQVSSILYCISSEVVPSDPLEKMALHYARLFLQAAALCFLTATTVAPVSLPSAVHDDGRLSTLSARHTARHVPLSASGHVYVAHVIVGTPPQAMSLAISTSSPHTWVPSVTAMACSWDYSPSFGLPMGDISSLCKWGVCELWLIF